MYAALPPRPFKGRGRGRGVDREAFPPDREAFPPDREAFPPDHEAFPSDREASPEMSQAVGHFFYVLSQVMRFSVVLLSYPK